MSALPRVARAFLGAALAAATLLGGAGCGEKARHQLAGQVLTPAPVFASLALPDASGAPFAMRARPGTLLLVYFGYTSCPDVCPTTLSDVRTALKRIGAKASAVQLAMVTIDPARDPAPKLAAYLDSFVTGSIALSTTDDAALRRVADAFGAQYSVTTSATGAPEVSHSAFLYALDDTGTLLVQWPFGIHAPTLADDLDALVDDITKRKKA